MLFCHCCFLSVYATHTRTHTHTGMHDADTHADTAPMRELTRIAPEPHAAHTAHSRVCVLRARIFFLNHNRYTPGPGNLTCISSTDPNTASQQHTSPATESSWGHESVGSVPPQMLYSTMACDTGTFINTGHAFYRMSLKPARLGNVTATHDLPGLPRS